MRKYIIKSQKNNIIDQTGDEDDENNSTSTIGYNSSQNPLIIHKSYEEIVSHIEKLIESTQEKQGIPFGRALLLLSRNNYDMNKIQVISDEKLLNLIYPTTSKAIEEMANLNSCLLCSYALTENNKYSLSCQHYFCNDCYSKYIQEVFSQGQHCIFKSCPLDGCLEKLGKEEFYKFLDEQKYNIYKKFIVKDALCNSQFFIPCPQPQCSIVQMSIKNEMANSIQRNIECQCKHEYCNLCKEKGHFPCNCSDFRKWLLKVDDTDQSNLNDQWLIMNTKPCPKCKVNIEKNQGCMHMTCKNCRHNFCWICAGDWKGHNDYYNCSKLDQAQLDLLEKEKKELSHFTFHKGQYQHHIRNTDIVQKEIDGIMNSLQKIQQQLIRNQQEKIDMEIINNYCQQVLRGRKYLPFFYAKGFFINDKPKLQFFSDLIEDYARLIDGFNKSFENLKNIVENNSGKSYEIVFKKSFIEFMEILPRKLGTCQTYIDQKLKQFVEDLDNFEKIASKKLTLLPVKCETIFKAKQQKHDDKQNQKEKQKQKEKEKENKLIEKQKVTITINKTFDNIIVIDSPPLKEREVGQKKRPFIITDDMSTVQQYYQMNPRKQFKTEVQINTNIQKQNNTTNQTNNEIVKLKESKENINNEIEQEILNNSYNSSQMCIDCGNNEATNEYNVCEECFDSLNE